MDCPIKNTGDFDGPHNRETVFKQLVCHEMDRGILNGSLGCFHQWEIPKNAGLRMENPIQIMDDLGEPWRTPISENLYPPVNKHRP